MTSIEELEAAIKQTRQSGDVPFGGAGDVRIIYNPYESHWSCSFSWSSGKVIAAIGNSMSDAVSKAVKGVSNHVENANKSNTEKQT